MRRDTGLTGGSSRSTSCGAMHPRRWLAACLLIALVGSQAAALAHGPLEAGVGAGAQATHAQSAASDRDGDAHAVCALCIALLQAKTTLPDSRGPALAVAPETASAIGFAAVRAAPRAAVRGPEGPRAPPSSR